MKLLTVTAAVAISALAAVPAFAQVQQDAQQNAPMTGTSTPPPALITSSPDDVTVPRAKPSADVGATLPSPVPSSTTYGAYVPFNPTGAAPSRAPFDPDAEIVTSTAGSPQDKSDAGIVTDVASRPNEVSEGTLLQSRIRETLSTASTAEGTPFTAEVTAPMERDGRVIIPAGSVINGRVTVVRGGRRINGAAALHLLTESVTLPDGTHYVLHAQVAGTSQNNVTRVDSEGTILRRDHVKGTLAAMSLTTGGAAAAGAVIGGVPGAFVGAGIGAGISTVWWLKQDRQEVVPENTGITFMLSTPLSITPLATGTK